MEDKDLEPLQNIEAENHDQPEDEYANYRKLLIFSVGEKQYAVDAGCVDEIINDTEIFPLPFVPDCVEGLINLRGQPVTVYNPFLNAEKDSGDKKNLANCNVMKFKRKNEAFGIRISTVETFLPEDKTDGIEELNVDMLETNLRNALGYEND